MKRSGGPMLSTGERGRPMVCAMKRTIGCLLAFVFLGIAAGCATNTEVERTKLPGVDKPAAETKTGN